ncbi:MAG: hypothetical protein H6Q75_5 [Firmicutes bacterium]|nr:hypothetical protein [Bacillota bacterium]
MAVINIPASKSLTLASKIPNGNIKEDKIIVGREGKCNYLSYLYFDLTSIPGSVVELLSATLVLFKTADFLTAPTPVFSIYPLLKQFSSYTTYNNECPIDLEPSLKCDFLPFTHNVAIEIDVTNIVNRWNCNRLANRGIVIKESYAKPYQTGHTSFGSAYNKDNMLIPFLRVKVKEIWWWLLPPNLTYTTRVIPPGRAGEKA